MAELRKVKTKFISLLHDEYSPTNEENLIIKSDNGFNKHTLEVVKSDNDIKGLITCIVMKANSVDTQGDWYSNETIDEAQAWHMDNIINQGKNEPSDTNHNFDIAKGIKLKESYVDKSTDNWKWIAILNIKEDTELMEKAKNGTLTGVSIAGEAQKIEDTEKGILKKIWEYIKGKENINKSEEIEMTKEELEAYLTEKLEGYVKKEVEAEVEKAEETPEAPEKETPEVPKVDIAKAIADGIAEAIKPLQEELKVVKATQMTGRDEITKIPDVNKMSNEELEKARKEDPEAYKKMLIKEAENRKK